MREGVCQVNEKRVIEVYEIFSKTVIIPLDKAKGGGRVKNRGWRTREGKYKEIPFSLFFLEEKTDKRTEVPNRFLSNPSMAFSSGIKVHRCS